jgi:hypothetical protein
VENQKLPLILAAVVLALSGAAWVYMKRAENAREDAALATQAAPAPAAIPSFPAEKAPEPPQQPLPTLDDSDAYARGAAQTLFTQALPQPWLQADRLIRRVTAAALIVADGASPRDSLSFLRPRGKFRVKRQKGRVTVDPASYARYDAVGDAAASLDAQAAARWIQASRPLFQAACGELDDHNCDIKDALVRSATLLLKTPVVQGDITLKAKVVTWQMTDETLESLQPAQKHLLRLGPRNEAKVQQKLRELALALGASDAELPKPAAYTPAP